MKRASVTEELAYGTALDRLTGTDKPPPTPKKSAPTAQPKINMIKLSVFLNGEEDAYLETLASAAKKETPQSMMLLSRPATLILTLSRLT